MLLLAVDTTTWSGSVALLERTRLLGEVNSWVSASHSTRLLDAVDFLLRKNSLKVKDIEGFAVAAGPGSFTGIRIGLSTVKAFAMASGKAVAAVSSLQALAMKLKDSQERLICPMIDAKKGEVYASLFESKGRSLKEVIIQGAYPPDRLLSLLPGHRVIHFIGSGAEVYKDKILAYRRDKARFSPRTPFIAYEIGILGYELLRKGKGVNPEDLEPHYFRKSQAEEKNRTSEGS